MKKAPEGHTDLYRHYDADGNLLYVGISLSAIARFQSHKRRATWLDSVATMKIERFSTRATAIEAERKAIMSENPTHNVCFSISGKPSETRPEWLPMNMVAGDLKQIINDAGHSTSSFASHLGMSRDTLTPYIKGGRPIPEFLALAATAVKRGWKPLE